MSEILLTILEREWQKGNNPDLYQVKCHLGVHGIQSETMFYSVLERLVESKKILLELRQKQFYVIVPYPTSNNSSKNPNSNSL